MQFNVGSVREEKKLCSQKLSFGIDHKAWTSGLCGWTKAMNLWRFGAFGNMFLEWLFPRPVSSLPTWRLHIFETLLQRPRVQVKFLVEGGENVMRTIRFRFSCNIHAAPSPRHRLGAPFLPHLTFFLLQWNVDSWRSFRWKWECLKTMKEKGRTSTGAFTTRLSTLWIFYSPNELPHHDVYWRWLFYSLLGTVLCAFLKMFLFGFRSGWAVGEKTWGM